VTAAVGVFPSIGMIGQPQASADLIDDDSGIAYTADEAIENYNLVAWALAELAKRNGGAAPSIKWLPKSRRAAHNARRLSHVRHDSATFPLDQSESPQSQTPIKVSEAASIIGVDSRTVYRLIDRDAVLALTITSRDPLRFDPELVKAYAAAHPRSRSRNDPEPHPTHRPI
jgi:hypothetical protein